MFRNFFKINHLHAIIEIFRLGYFGPQIPHYEVMEESSGQPWDNDQASASWSSVLHQISNFWITSERQKSQVQTTIATLNTVF